MSELQNYGFLSLLYSISDNPLSLWSKHVSSDGRIRRIEDESLNGDRVIEICGTDNSPISTSLSCPANAEDCLNIQLPVLAIVMKNLKSRVQLAIQVIDEESIRRKFILSTCENPKRTGHEIETARIPLKLDEGWNLLEINLGTLCQSTYCAEYRALQRLIIYPNCRLRRVYLQDRHYKQNETPIQLCQAFFDMYLLKWGIHFVEKSCQTNETLEAIKNAEETPTFGPNDAFRPPEKISMLKHVSPVTRSTKKNDFPASDTAANDFIRKKNSKTPIKPIKPIKKKNDGEERKVSIPSRVSSARHSARNEKDGEIFRKWPYNYAHLQQVMQGRSANSADSRDFPTEKTRFPIIVNSFGSAFPSKKHDSSTSALTGLHIIPSVVEAASTESTKSVESTKSKLLTTDEAVGDFLELRHVINRKMLENFRVRGLTMTEVELSIYNSKNRKNSYGQGKLLKKHRISVDKACHVASSERTIECPRKTSATI